MKLKKDIKAARHLPLFYLSFFLWLVRKKASPEAFVPALKVLIALINADELRCKTFVDAPFITEES